MQNGAIDKSSLGYLGEEYQYKLVKEFMEDKSCFKELAPIIDPNMFTGQYLRIYVGTMLEYMKTHGSTPSYSSMSVELRQLAHTQIDIEIYEGVINKIRTMSSDGSEQTRDLAMKFFKQQNIIKAANEMLKLAGDGDVSNYDKCEELIRNALNVGTHEDYEEACLFDGVDETLSKDFRTVIPTGIGKIDETLNGGIGLGELGIIVGPSGYGKVQPYDSKIVTPDGFRDMKDIHVGSLVIGADGKPHKVTGVYPHKDWDFYKVTFSDGTSTECGMEHLWNVNTKWQRSGEKYVKGVSKRKEDGRYTKHTCPDLSYRTMSLKEISESGLYRGKNKVSYNFKVPITSAVEFKERKVDIDPYVMGCMIGDGCFKSAIITIGKRDYEEEVSYITESEEKYSPVFYNGIAQGIRLTDGFRTRLSEYYDANTVCTGKYIHEDYLYNSIENRIKLLNGLMDTDGTCGKRGYCVYTTKSKRLAYDVMSLVQSLGGLSRISEKKCGYKDKEGIKVDCGIAYSVTVLFYDSNIPVFRLKRKQERVKYGNSKLTGRYIKSIEYSRKCDGQCIQIDSEDELYLTDSYIVTHNTTVTTAMALNAASFKSEQNNFEGFKVMQIVFEDRIKQIQRKHFSKITQIEACNLSKDEYADHVKSILEAYPDRDVVQNNLRIIRLKSGEKSIDFIGELIKKHINSGFRPHLVIIDYFECIKLTGPSTSSKWDKETMIMRKIEAMANELNIAFWIPVQGNRDSINAELVTMDNAGGSLGKIQIGHIIMSITRSVDDIADNIATISILKNRAGQSGKVIDGVIFNNGTCTISTDNISEYDSGVEFGRHREDVHDSNIQDLTKSIFNSTKK